MPPSERARPRDGEQPLSHWTAAGSGGLDFPQCHHGQVWLDVGDDRDDAEVAAVTGREGVADVPVRDVGYEVAEIVAAGGEKGKRNTLARYADAASGARWPFRTLARRRSTSARRPDQVQGPVTGHVAADRAAIVLRRGSASAPAVKLWEGGVLRAQVVTTVVVAAARDEVGGAVGVVAEVVS
jgi:hypothetical protein